MALSYYDLHINFDFGVIFPFEYLKLYKLTRYFLGSIYAKFANSFTCSIIMSSSIKIP